MVPFVFGEDHNPVTAKVSIQNLDVREKLKISTKINSYPKDSIYEHLINELLKVSDLKAWSNEETAREFARLLTREPP